MSRIQGKKSNKTTATSCIFNRTTHQHTSRKKEGKRDKDCCYNAIYIFHEFVLEHALGNRINVYCPQSILSPSNEQMKKQWSMELFIKKTETQNIKHPSKPRQREYIIYNENYQRDLSCRSINHDFNRTENVCVCVIVYFLPFIFLVIRSPFCVFVRNESCSFVDEQKHLILNCWSFLFNAFHAFN